MFESSITSAFERVFSKKAPAIEPISQADYDFTGKRVLLAEDHPLNVEVAKRLLEKKGLSVDVAGNGLEAIECYSQAPAGYYDIILMDIRMPEMDGLTAAASIRKLKKSGSREIPIVAMTANAFEEDVEKSKASGMNAHLAKPIDPKQLYATIAKFVEQKS